MGNFLAMTPAAVPMAKKKEDKSLITKLERLSKTPISSSTSYHTRYLTTEILRLSLTLPKPLFINEYQKYIAAAYIEKSLALIEKTVKKYDHDDETEEIDYFYPVSNYRSACQTLSGMQYLIDEFKENQDIYDKLKPIFETRAVKSIEKYIKRSLNMYCIDPSNETLNTIPASHVWWFWVETDEDEEDDDDE